MNTEKITLTIHNEATISANGKKRTKNAKPIFCIDTGEVFASSLDAAEKMGVSPSTLCAALTGKTKTCQGKRYCFVSKIPEYFDEITAAMQVRETERAEYHKIIGHQQAIKDAEARVKMHKETYLKLQQKLEDEMNAYYKAEEDLKKLTEEG